MTLESTEIETQLEQLSTDIKAIRTQAIEVKKTTARAASKLSQMQSDYSELFASVNKLKNSDNIVDKLHVARLEKILAEGAALKSKIDIVKAAIDPEL